MFYISVEWNTGSESTLKVFLGGNKIFQKEKNAIGIASFVV